MRAALVALAVIAAAANARSDSTVSMTVTCTSAEDGITCVPTTDGDTEYTSTATYSPDTDHKSFFGELHVSTNEAAESDAVAMFGAGFVEGALTAERRAHAWPKRRVPGGAAARHEGERGARH